MAKAVNPYGGDGNAAKKIVDIIINSNKENY